MKIFNLEQIRSAVPEENYPELIQLIEEAFFSYTKGSTVIPPAGLLQFPKLDADVHIKYGYISGDDSFVIKIASGFPHNTDLGLPVSSGMILVFSSQTGELKGILEDKGYLTDLRTAIAGAICAKYLAPSVISAVGIVGTGIQAAWQLRLLRRVVDFEKVYVYGRNPEHADDYCRLMEQEGFNVVSADSLGDLAQKCNLIVTTTYASEPIITGDMLQPGTHITAMGADSPGKNEIDAVCFAKASKIVCDSYSQCSLYGDTSYALNNGIIEQKQVMELGDIINRNIHRTDEKEITIADLTGVAVQDIAIARYVMNRLSL